MSWDFLTADELLVRLVAALLTGVLFAFVGRIARTANDNR